MTLNKLNLAYLILILFITGCTKKDELTLPVRIQLNFCGNRFNRYSFSSPESRRFEITEGWIGIQKMRFRGIRESGGDISFETDPKIDFPTFNFTDKFEPISDFDIPQGTYNTFNWDIYLKEVTADESITGEDITSMNPGLILKGYYDREWWSGYDIYEKLDSAHYTSIIFIVPDTVLISKLISNIVLSDNKDYVVNLQVDSRVIFSSIDPNEFENAEKSGNTLEHKVIISRDKNTPLYEYLMERLKMSLSIHVY